MSDRVILDDYFLGYLLWKDGILFNGFLNDKRWLTLALVKCLEKSIKTLTEKSMVSVGVQTQSSGNNTQLNFLHTSLVGVVYLSFGPEATDPLIQLIVLSEKCRNKRGLMDGWIEEHRNLSPEPTLGWGDTLIAGVCISKPAESSMTTSSRQGYRQIISPGQTGIFYHRVYSNKGTFQQAL